MSTSDRPASEAQTRVIEQLRAAGRPLTKVEYLRAMYTPFSPEFPLDAEIAAEIPDELDGELPESLVGYLRALGHDV